MSIPLPRFAQKEVREFARELTRELHLEYAGTNASGHHVFAWPETGGTMQLADTPSTSTWRQNAARTAVRLVGADVATARLRSWAGMDGKRRSAADRKLDAERKTTPPPRIEQLAHIRPAVRIPTPAARRDTLVHLRNYLVGCNGWDDVRRVDAALDHLGALETCAVPGCPVRFRAGFGRLCEMHKQEDAYADINIRFYRELMSAA